MGRPAGWPHVHSRCQKRYRRKDGGVIWADVRSFLLPSAESERLLAVFAVDITHRKQAEEDLRRSQAFLVQAQEISHWTVKTGEVRWSEEHFRIFGYDPAATQPSYAIFTEQIHPDDRPLVEQMTASAVVEKGPFRYEYRIVLPDGSVKHLLSIGRPGITESGDALKESLFPTGLIFDCPGAAWFRLPRFPSGYAGASRIKDAIGK